MPKKQEASLKRLYLLLIKYNYLSDYFARLRTTNTTVAAAITIASIITADWLSPVSTLPVADDVLLFVVFEELLFAGAFVAAFVGADVGAAVGAAVAGTVGFVADVGASVSGSVGAAVGASVGSSVGSSVGTSGAPSIAGITY